jgi:hypothetical protein
MKNVTLLRALGLAICIAAGILAGCGGGGGGSTLPSAGGSGSKSSFATATLHIIVPEKTTNGRRRPAYVSPSTTQLAWSINGQNQATVPLTTPSPCSSSGSGLSCNVNFQVAPGTYTFVFTLEDVNGNTLSIGTATNYTLTAGIANTLTVTLGGVASGFKVTSSSNNFGTSGSLFTVFGGAAVTLTINTVDVDNNIIINPGAPTITATLLPSPSPPATLSGSGSTWTLTSSYQPSNPTVPGPAVLAITASPYAGSGATGLTGNVQFLFYVPWLYITNSSGKVVAFDELGNAQSPAPLVSGLHGPAAVAFGASTAPPYLYVATVTTPTPVPTPTGSNTPGPIVGGIVAYNGDGTTPSPAPSAFSGVGIPVGLAFDTHNNELYALNSPAPSLQAFAASGGSNTITSPTISGPTGIVFNSANNELYVSTTSGVFAYTESGTLDSSVSFTGLSSAAGVAYDAHNDEIYAVSSSGVVSIYPAAGGSQVATFSTTITSPSGLLYDPYQHWIYVIGSSGIAAYSEAGVPQTLSGSFSGLGTPTSITVVQ